MTITDMPTRPVGGLMSIEQQISTGLWKDSGETCEIHHAPKYILNLPTNPWNWKENRPEEGFTKKFCLICHKKKMREEEEELIHTEEANSKLSQGYGYLLNNSIWSDVDKNIRIETFKATTRKDYEALNFAKRTIRDKVNGSKHNVSLFGPPGRGKSYILCAIANKLNEDYKDWDEPKKVLYISVPRLFQLMKAAFDDESSPYQEKTMSKLMIEADFLFLDDIGKESASNTEIRSSSAWAYKFLFDVLNARQGKGNTFWSTNYTGLELKKIYDASLVSRLGAGTKDYHFKFMEGDPDKRAQQYNNEPVVDLPF